MSFRRVPTLRASLGHPAKRRLLATKSAEVYERKTPLEHVLLRPGMYIGSVESVKTPLWVLSKEAGSTGSAAAAMEKREVEVVPGVCKIFDEILVNAADNLQRDASMDRIEVHIDDATSTTPEISVLNTGRGVPITKHKDGLYVPELVFGYLFTGSNFDDNEARLTGGRHGFGAKLTNIFSSRFEVETVDARRRQRYTQVWRDNMGVRAEPEITGVDDGASDYTRVTFRPDLARFGIESLGDNADVMRRRVWDIAGCNASVDVYVDGTLVPINSFSQYSKLYMGGASVDRSSGAFMAARLNPRWEVGVAASESGAFENVSFVNSIHTGRGGTHVAHLADQIAARVTAHVRKQRPDLPITPASVKAHLSLFVNGLVENPSFESQTKEFLATPPAQFGSACVLPARFTNKLIAESSLVERVVEQAEMKVRSKLLKKSGPRTRSQIAAITKLSDANLAGGAEAGECTLILTEGDSAKALAVAGLATVGRDTYGVYPLRGKMLNVRDATLKQLAQNKELTELCTILGLDKKIALEAYFGGAPLSDVEEVKMREKMRYGRVVVMADQDLDGSHIKGLVMNFFDCIFPTLLRDDTFFASFRTPIIRATPPRRSGSGSGGKTKTKKKKKKEDMLSFYSLRDYETWRSELIAAEHASSAVELSDSAATVRAMKGWGVKYYKGLGTSSSAEAREYFGDLDKHLVPLTWAADGEDNAERLSLAFSKDRAADRREWLLGADLAGDATAIDVNDTSLSYVDFVDKELVHFSHADSVRSIPSMVDGLKPSQRKVLFACLKRNLTREIKVAQLAGYVAEHTAYHHGEVSLHSTIVNMAQDFVGANNLPLLKPSGQFGTRLQGGKDAASSRYIFTHLDPIVPLLFKPDDDPVLAFGEDDGMSIEPEWYMPVIPFALVNGCDGIGTGWSTSVPSHHPLDVAQNVRRHIEGEAMEEMTPWVRGFKGVIEPLLIEGGGAGGAIAKFTSIGDVETVPKQKNSIRVTELPVRRWTETYKEWLSEQLQLGVVKDFRENHSEVDVDFTVHLTPAGLDTLLKTGAGRSKKAKGAAGKTAKKKSGRPTKEEKRVNVIKALRLESTISCTNMHLFNAEGKIRKYDSALDLIEEWVPLRLNLYAKRREVQLEALEERAQHRESKAQFIRDVVAGASLANSTSFHVSRLASSLSSLSLSLSPPPLLLQVKSNSLTRKQRSRGREVNSRRSSSCASFRGW